jgi:PHS family inorganic phosphate transporter-like MFS transporter
VSLPGGPNTTTFIVPGECFPTRYRSTSHGISAASGKIGSIIAQGAISPLRVRGKPTTANPSPWLNHVMQIFSAFMFAGIFTTLLIPETKRRTLEDLAMDWDMGNESITGAPVAPKHDRSSDEAATEVKA